MDCRSAAVTTQPSVPEAMCLSLKPLYGAGFGAAFLQLCTFYYITGALLHWIIPALLPVTRIQPITRKPGVVLRDAIYSLGPLAVKAGVWTIVERLFSVGQTLLYSEPVNTVPHALYCLLVVILLDILHDTWFYWTHRLLHWGLLYRHVHYIHHKSSAPCAFTGYSFHVIEAAIVFANEVLVCWLLPMHVGLHRIYHLLTTAVHQGGHVGYEIAPFIPTAEAVLHALLRGHKASCPGLNTVQHHDWHHRFPLRHFSLYFTHWDRWCGTLHPKYDQELFQYFPSTVCTSLGANEKAISTSQHPHTAGPAPTAATCGHVEPSGTDHDEAGGRCQFLDTGSRSVVAKANKVASVSYLYASACPGASRLGPQRANSDSGESWDASATDSLTSCESECATAVQHNDNTRVSVCRDL